MKIEATKKIQIKNIEIGGSKTLICTPITPSTHEDFVSDIDYALSQNPDVVEWRLDYFDNLSSLDYVYNTLTSIKYKLANTIFILTLRDNKEGGKCTLSQEDKLKIIKSALKTDTIDILDIEQIQGKDYISSVKQMINNTNTKLLLSYHNFEFTPNKEEIVQKIKKALELGADIPKVAYMPHSSEDVLCLLDASISCRKLLEAPIVSISMGDLGKISRVYAGQFGSDITFASLKDSTAPGQIKIDDLKRAWTHLF